MTPEKMTKDERTCLLYLETCAVDYGGLVQGARMNKADHEACARFAELGLATIYRVPSRLFTTQSGQVNNHFVMMTEAGFALAHQLRRQRADRLQKQGTPLAVIAELVERGKLAVEVA
jgi:hypothetical protein